ncbi:MAG: serine/threonine protein kinase [Deltaproteobacteria bacterium]|nr:serine/threonine protein kinase [Deltaproteobacteria bacterium]
MAGCDRCGGERHGPGDRCPAERIGGTVASRYRLKRLLGMGGMGVVYEAEHLGLGTSVALKTLHPELATDAEVRERFRREAQRAASLRHPGIVTVLDYGQDETGSPYIALELLRGESLQDVLERHGPLPIAKSVAVVASVLEALEHAHGQGVVHRDLKAANVFLARGATDDEPTRVKVVDFGIAKATTDRQKLTRTGMILGSPEMMPPEQVVAAGHVDARADVYAAGALLFQLLTATPPARGASVFEVVSRVARGDIDRHPSARRAEVPEWLDAIVARALAREPSDRFQSAEGMRRALVSGAGQLAEVASRSSAARGDASGKIAIGSSPVMGAAFGAMTVPMPASAGSPTGASAGAAKVAMGATTPAPMLALQPGEPTRTRGRGALWALLALVILGASATAFVLAGRAGWFRPRTATSSPAQPDPAIPQLPPPPTVTQSPAPPPNHPPILPPPPVTGPTLLPSTPAAATPTLLPSPSGPSPTLVPQSPVTPPTPTSFPPPTLPTSTPSAFVDGLWRGDFGLMAFRTIAPGVVRGVYPHDSGTLTGTLIGNRMTGWWCELPSRAPNADAGEFEMQFAPHGQSVDGRWRYGTTAPWRENWNLRRLSMDIPPDLASRFTDTSSFCTRP